MGSGKGGVAGGGFCGRLWGPVYGHNGAGGCLPGLLFFIYKGGSPGVGKEEIVSVSLDVNEKTSTSKF